MAPTARFLSGAALGAGCSLAGFLLLVYVTGGGRGNYWGELFSFLISWRGLQVLGSFYAISAAALGLAVWALGRRLASPAAGAVAGFVCALLYAVWLFWRAAGPAVSMMQLLSSAGWKMLLFALPFGLGGAAGSWWFGRQAAR